MKSRFIADALGPSGHYTAGETAKLSGMTRRAKIANGQEAHAILVVELQADGWERVGAWGPEWWQERFRRTLAPEAGLGPLTLET